MLPKVVVVMRKVLGRSLFILPNLEEVALVQITLGVGTKTAEPKTAHAVWQAQDRLLGFQSMLSRAFRRKPVVSISNH